MNNEDEIKLWKEKTKGLFNIVEWTRFWNYITNLQEENEKNKAYSEFYKDMSNKWKDLLDVLKKGYDDYKSKNEKAIEYIKEHQRKDEFLNLNEWQTRDLLNILQGEDKYENN